VNPAAGECVKQVPRTFRSEGRIRHYARVCKQPQKAHLRHAAESDLLVFRGFEPLRCRGVMNVFGNVNASHTFMSGKQVIKVESSQIQLLSPT
jgi:hypothetical protein